MIEQRRLLRFDLAQWLRIRERLRAQDARLTAARYRAEVEAAASDEPLPIDFAARIEAERTATAALSAGCDARIDELRSSLAALDAAPPATPTT